MPLREQAVNSAHPISSSFLNSDHLRGADEVKLPLLLIRLHYSPITELTAMNICLVQPQWVNRRPCWLLSVIDFPMFSLLNTIFHIELNKNEWEKLFSSSRSNSRFLWKYLPLFFCLKLGVLEMFKLFPCLRQLTIFGIDIAEYTNGLTKNGDVNEKFPN